ncbi:vitelline membrane outer layer protein 1-like [Penaeus japonicus]|uniref:vitelline membrane outer layer protein 1-like n=1 Tax=Penaeus japonicus TaxID=27405 RepID=UPI001C716A4B|nr:vitelline membrane outer layer protein 1-like [Penaeus japonicus]
MGGCVAFLWASLVVLWASSYPAHSEISTALFRKFEGKQIATNIIAEGSFPKSPRKGKLECSSFCHNSQGCQCFNLGKAAPYHCQLLSFKKGDTVSASSDYDLFISVNAKVRPVDTGNGGPWGSWHEWAYCLPGSYMNSLKIKFDSYNGAGLATDDFGITHLQMFCTYPNGSEANEMIVGVNDVIPPGEWEPIQVCPEGTWLRSWMQSVTPSLGSDDDDALNNIVFICSSDSNGRSDQDGLRLTGTGDSRYSKSAAVKCPFSTVPCGVRTRVEVYQGSGDDSAVNHVQFTCCFIDV